MEPACPAVIASAYSLENATVVGQFESYGNDNWLIRDARGQQYVLRRHRLNADVRRIEFHLALQQHLSGRGVPTSDVVETVSRRGYALDEDGVPWVLYTYIAGGEYDFQCVGQLRQAARTLAQFHEITESLQWDAPAPAYKVPLRECWVNATQDLMELSELFRGGSAAEELAYLSEWWRRVVVEWPLERLDALPSGWVHGDFHGRNLAFDGEHVVGLFDFDDVDRGPYAYDLAAGLLKFGREARGSLRIRPDFARAFVAGYETLRPVSQEERAALPMMVAMGYPPHPRNYRYWRERGEDIERRLRREVATIRTLRAEVERIAVELS